MNYTRTERVAAPAAQVWAALVAVEDWPRWTPSITRVTRGDTGDLDIGSSARIKQPGFGAARWSVSEFEPDVGFVWVSRDPGSTSIGGHRLIAEGEETTLELTLRRRGPLARVVASAFGRRFRRWVDLEADGLRRAGESLSSR